MRLVLIILRHIAKHHISRRNELFAEIFDYAAVSAAIILRFCIRFVLLSKFLHDMLTNLITIKHGTAMPYSLQAKYRPHSA